MPLKANIFLFLFSFALLLYVTNLIVKRKLKIEYSILWFAVSLSILAMILWQNFADQIAFLLGIEYPPALFFAIAIFFALLILFYYSVEISKLKEQNKTLNQELSLNRQILKKILDKTNLG